MKRKKIFNLIFFSGIFFIFSFTPFITRADDVTYNWAKQIGQNGIQQDGFSIETDEDGNVYISGSFQNTPDFDPGPGVYSLTSAGDRDIYIAKYTADGNFLWAKRLGGATGWDLPTSLVLDENNVYVTGRFLGTVDFNPDPDITYNVTSAGSYDNFILKLDLSGNFLWVRNFGGTLSDASVSIFVDMNSNVYTTGYFQSTVDFDPSESTSNLISAGVQDIFIYKLNSSGDLVFAKRIGNTNSEMGQSITVDDNHNIYIAGSFKGTVDFDPSENTFDLTSSVGSQDMFVSKYDELANLIWVKNIGGAVDALPNMNYYYSIVLDQNDDIYVTGSFQGTADFDPSGATSNLTSAGGRDIFVLKLNNSGDFIWAKQIGGAGNDWGRSIAVDSVGSPYIGGTFSGGISSAIVDFDPGAGTYNINGIAGGDSGGDIFFLKLDSSGNFVFAKGMGGTTGDTCIGIDVDMDNNIYITGLFSATVDFDPSLDSHSLSVASSYDIYFAKYAYVDTMPPSVSGFIIPSTSKTLSVPITTFTLTDNIGVPKYLITESDTSPSVDDVNWSSVKPSAYIFGDGGNKILYAWAKDTAGNISNSSSDTIIVDVNIPVITLVGENYVDLYLRRDTSYVDAGARAVDDLDGDITGNIITINNVNVQTEGTYIITYNVSDSVGNEALETTRTVNVRKPEMTGILIPVLSKLHTQPQAKAKLPTQTPTNTIVSLYNFTKNLKPGDIDVDIKEIQKFLNTHGYIVSLYGPGSSSKETNFFGPKTKSAIIKFQLANGLVGDGIIGPLTRAKLK